MNKTLSRLCTSFVLMILMIAKGILLEGTKFLWVVDMLVWVLLYAGAILFAYLASIKLEKKAAFLFEKVEP